MSHATETAGEGTGIFCPPERRVYVLVAAILASSMGFIDGSVVSIAMPAIRADLDASLASGQWVSNAYMLFLSSLILIGGAAGDRFGLRRVFAFAIVGFGLASGVCALAPDVGFLIGARAIQGIAAAMMVPASLAIIAKAYPSGERGRAIGIWAAASAVTTTIGPVGGGLLLSALGDSAWRLIFAINLPIAVVALAMLILRVPADRPGQRHRLDLVGAGLAVVSLFLIAFGLTGTGEEGSVPSLERVALLSGTGLLLLAGFVIWERRTEHPMVPMRLFANRTFSGANLLTFFLYFALSAVQFYLPMTVISGWGVSAAEIAAAFLPVGLGLAVLSGPAGALADRVGAAPLVAGGAALVSLAYVGLALVLPLQAFWTTVMPCLVVMGVGMGFVVSPLSTAVMTSVADADTGTASGVNNAVARMAGLIAVAAMGGVAAFVFRVALDGSPAVGEALSFGVPPDAPLSAPAEAGRQAAGNAAFAAVSWITAGLSAASALVAWLTLEHKWHRPRDNAPR